MRVSERKQPWATTADDAGGHDITKETGAEGSCFSVPLAIPVARSEVVEAGPPQISNHSLISGHESFLSGQNNYYPR